jgi:hypothetical protein
MMGTMKKWAVRMFAVIGVGYTALAGGILVWAHRSRRKIITEQKAGRG